MATVAPNPSGSVLGRIRDSAQTLVAGLAWAGVMLIVFRFWIQIKHVGRSPILANIFLVAGLAVLGLAGWQAFVLWLRKDTPEQKAETLASQRRLFSLVLLGGGFALIVLAFVLGLGKKVGGSYGFLLDNFGESAGLLLFGITGLFYGWTLQQPADESASPIRLLIDKAPILKMAMIVLMVVSMGVFAYVVINNRAGNLFLAYTPQLMALLFLSITAGMGFFRLNTDTHSESGVRFFVLIFGGLTGLNLFVLSAGLAYLWRDDVGGGEAAWHGDNNWRLWLCAYTMIVGLVVMMVSLNLARTDVRQNAGLRRAMYGYNAILQGMLLLAMLVVLNFIVAKKYPFTYDWNKMRGAYALSDSGQNIVKGLKKELNLIVLMSERDPAYKDTKILLENCKSLNQKFFKVDYVSPDTVEREAFEKLVATFPQILPEPGAGDIGRGVLVIYGAMPTENNPKVPPYTLVRDRRLTKQERPQGPGGKASSQYLGESEIFKEIKFLAQERIKHKVYILQGNEEPDINNDESSQRLEIRYGFQLSGLGIFVEKLKNENFDVVGLTFDPLAKEEKKMNTPVIQAKVEASGHKRSIPGDCKTLIIAGVSRTLNRETVDAIEDYLKNGGKVLAFLDVISEDDYSKMRSTGLEPMLKSYGVEVTNEFAIRIGNDPTTLIALAARPSTNVLASQFKEKKFFLRKSARGLQASAQPGGSYKAESVLQVDPAESLFLVETDLAIFKDPIAHITPLARNRFVLEAKMARKPMSVGMAVSKDEKPAMVVFGDTEWITNDDLLRSRSSANTFALVLGSIEWMAERPSFVGAQPKVTTSFSFEPGYNFGRMVFLPGWIMFLAFILLGITVWVIRRR